MNKLLCTVIVAMVSLGAASAQCEFPPEVCAAQEAFERNDEELGLTLELIYLRIDDDDFADFLVDPAELASSLEQSQTAWRAYQEVQCAAVFRLMGDSMSSHVDELTCLAELAEARISQLRVLYQVTADKVTDDDLSWLNGVWYESCDFRQAAFNFYVSNDGVYAEVAPDEASSDQAKLAEAEILLGYNGFVEVTPFGWDNKFLRIRSAGEGRIVGDLFEVFSDTIAPLEAIDLVECPAIRDADE